MSKTLCLVMIVRDEAKVIERCLNSVKHLIDYAIIIDTGSIDDTISKIHTSLEEIPHEVHESPWVNYCINRSEAVALAKDKTDYAILLDADQILEISPEFDKDKLEGDGYFVRYAGSCDFAQIALINNRLKWYYEGVVHAYVTSKEARVTKTLDTLKLVELGDGGNKHRKFDRDIKLLNEALDKEPTNSRYRFYLAQSYRDTGRYAEAIENYLKRIELGKWAEEIYFSKYRIGYCYEMLKDYVQAKRYYLEAFEYRPTRVESLYHLAIMCRNQREYQQGYMFTKRGLEAAYPGDLLFIERPVYEYLMLFEKSIHAYWIGKYQEAFDDCETLLNMKNLPDNVRRQTLTNQEFSRKRLLK